MFGSGKSIVGLDIGSSCIKAIELKRSKGEIVVSHLGVEPLASDVVVDSMIVDSGHVSTAITKIFSERSIKTKQVAIGFVGIKHAAAMIGDQRASRQIVDEGLGDVVAGLRLTEMQDADGTGEQAEHPNDGEGSENG